MVRQRECGVNVLWRLELATAAKHQLYKRYLDAWWPIMLQPSSRDGRLWPRVTYLDAAPLGRARRVVISAAQRGDLGAGLGEFGFGAPGAGAQVGAGPLRGQASRTARSSSRSRAASARAWSSTRWDVRSARQARQPPAALTDRALVAPAWKIGGTVWS
jgi:hypothetical protein